MAQKVERLTWAEISEADGLGQENWGSWLLAGRMAEGIRKLSE